MPTSPRALTLIYRADVGISPYNTNKIQMLFHIKMYKSCISDQNIVGGVKREKTIKQDQRK